MGFARGGDWCQHRNWPPMAGYDRLPALQCGCQQLWQLTARLFGAFSDRFGHGTLQPVEVYGLYGWMSTGGLPLTEGFRSIVIRAPSFRFAEARHGPSHEGMLASGVP